MAETPRSEQEPSAPEIKLDKALSISEAKDSSIFLRGAEGFKGYVAKGGKIAGVTAGTLLLLAGALIFKILEKSALLMKGIIENPDKPEKWIEPLKKSFKGDKKESK
jgi:hypothetical protein